MTMTTPSHKHKSSDPPPVGMDNINAALPVSKKAASRFRALRSTRTKQKRVFDPLPRTSQARLDATLNDAPVDTKRLAEDDLGVKEKEKTVLYLAYGSNLCAETFRGARGIRPLSQVNVQVPSLRLTFDLAGFPYQEPCFANTARRTPLSASHTQTELDGKDYHKLRWKKDLVGVVYEVTLKDYAHIIATEGGGAAYQDILVDCHALPEGASEVPIAPSSRAFKAHTLFAPMQGSAGETVTTVDRVSRPDPNYAQPSARYLKLITDGADECGLPEEYKDYLHDIRPYTITTRSQQAGKALYLAIWLPLITIMFGLAKIFKDKKGRSPPWFVKAQSLLFLSMWACYDKLFKDTFGDGERTIGDEALATGARNEASIYDEEKAGLLVD